ncbi:hypothetical protein BDV95DRAFT_619976 [Massariosphaeria phaeospora]|uniref:DUF6604 domain-containing protein n=1 Tax=Massariosphaeria phaeospora TaxID=100035 RepID=A0A7C8ID57_9PLEO|nr:hypothetical protein BDV95DRAFT_619976 [Massariosphaeria phaeospora]
MKDLVIRNFVDFAEIIAHCPQVAGEIPKHIQDLLEEVIRLRTIETTIYQPLIATDTNAAREYNRHWAFIEVLQKIDRMLKLGVEQHRQRNPLPVSRLPEPREDIKSLFDKLLVEDIDGTTEDNSTGSDNGAATDNAAPIASTLDKGSDDLNVTRASVDQGCYTATLQLLGVIQELKSEAIHVWKQYAAKKVTLVTAALITNLVYRTIEHEVAQHLLLVHHSLFAATDRPDIGVLDVLLHLYEVWQEQTPQNDHDARANFREVVQTICMPVSIGFMVHWLLKDDHDYTSFLATSHYTTFHASQELTDNDGLSDSTKQASTAMIGNELIMRDPVSQVAKAFGQQQPPLRFQFNNNPVLNGTLALRLQLNHFTGVAELESSAPNIASTLLWYVALQQSGYLDADWEDAEFVLKCLGSDALFQRDPLPSGWLVYLSCAKMIWRRGTGSRALRLSPFMAIVEDHFLINSTDTFRRLQNFLIA